MRTKFILFCLLAAATMNAQLLTYQHTFTESVSFVSWNEATQTSNYYYEDLSDLNGDFYYSRILDYDNYTYTIKQYGADYSLVSTKVFNVPTMQDYSLNSFVLTRTVFDDDPKTYEFIVSYSKYNQTDYTTEYKMLIYSENGNVLFDLGTSAGYMYAYNELQICNNEYRFCVRKEGYDSETAKYVTCTDIYKVNNKKSARGLKQVPAGQMPKKVMIDNQIYIIKDNKVFDMQGRVMPQM